MRKTEADKVIFLDFDGVMTSKLDGTSYECGKPYSYAVSEKCLKLLSKIIFETGAKVVISSNWRRFQKHGHFSFSGKDFENQIPRLRKLLGSHCIGDLPHDRHISKSKAVILWAEDRDVELDGSGFEYVILDDMGYEMNSATPDMLKRFVHCDGDVGLTEEDAERAISILNG